MKLLKYKYLICVIAIFFVFVYFVSNNIVKSNKGSLDSDIILPDEQLESYFNLSAVDSDGDGNPDKSYITPIKSQGLGICWSYAIMETAETHMMVTNNEAYHEGTTKILSPRQLDYLNIDMINGYKNPFSMANFSTGGDFDSIDKLLAYGLSFASIDWEQNNSVTDTSQNKLDYKDVLNFHNSLYELDSTIVMPKIKMSELDFSKSDDVEKYNNYIKTIKRFIKMYGGPYISTGAPSYSCSTRNPYDNYSTGILGINEKCLSGNYGGHAMQIVGWDDNYKYKYCAGRNNSENDDCNEEDIVDGVGAWIIRNSWGESFYKYVYLPYKTDIDDYTKIIFISKLSHTSEKKWNYIINTGEGDYSNPNLQQYIINFKSQFDIDAKLVKVKFKNAVENGKFKVYISENGGDSNYSLIKELTVEYPGYVTIDLSNNNYRVNNNSKIKIVSENEGIYTFNVHAFIKEMDNSYIATSNYNIGEATEDGSYKKLYVYSDTYNIGSDETITYKVYDDNGVDITNQTSVKNNTVGFNGVNALLSLPKEYSGTYYTLKTYYNNNLKSTSKIVVSGNGLRGSGTKDSPYIISTVDDFHAIGDFLNANYVLENDIDLTNDAQNKKGWESFGKRKDESFTGSLDGKNHKIIGLNVGNAGLFYKMGAEGKESSIKNIVFENARVQRSALLVGYISSRDNANIEISNIAVMNSTFGRDSQLISFRLSVDGGSLKIKNIFSNSKVNNNLYSLIDGAESFNSQNFSIENIEILGRFDMKDNEDIYRSTPLFLMGAGNLKVSNMIFNNNVNMKINLSYDIENDEDNRPQFKNIYYLGEVTNTQPQFYTNSQSKTLDELKNQNNYSNWNNFNDNWVIREIDGIKRIPILKFVSFEYTSISDIELNENAVVNLYNYLTPKIDAARNIVYEIADSNIASIDKNGDIRGLTGGETTIHVISYYDGFEKDVKVSVKGKSDACYMDSNGEYSWGEHSDDSTYTLVSSIVEANKCTNTIDVPKTDMNVSKLMYIFMVVLMSFGVMCIYYSSHVQKKKI